MAFTTRDDFERRVRTRLLPADFEPDAPVRSDFDLAPGMSPLPPVTPVRAAVLIALVDRGEDFGTLLTLRPETMSRHAGQIAFPGGRVDASDINARAAALREAEEEVGLERSLVEMLGQGDPYLTSTGFLVAPFIGIVPASFRPRPAPLEVADVFEAPLSFLMRPENHARHTRRIGELERSYFAMPYNGRYIWGATAGMLKSLYDRLYAEPGGD